MRNDFETLEKKCKSYRLKKNLKFLGGFLLITTFVSFISYYFLQDEEPNREIRIQKEPKKLPLQKKIKKVAPIKQEKKKEKALTTVKVVTPQIVQEKKHKDILYSIEIDNNYIIPQKKEIIQKKEKRVKKITPPQNSPKIEELQPTPEPIKERKKAKSFKIDLEKLDTVKKMESKYKKEPKYKLALQIAQTYYDQKNYTKALLWTKKANILNKKADGAWILYAKTEYAKGHKKRAIEILQLYLANASSTEGDELLLSWSHKK